MPTNDRPWTDEELIRQRYFELKSTTRVAEEFGCVRETVRKWLEHFDIDRKFGNGYRPLTASLDSSGYQRFHNSDHDVLFLHHLVAIAHGADPHTVFGDDDVHVHHLNGLSWDNRPENLELRGAAEHLRQHRLEDAHKRERNSKGQFM